MQIFNSCPIALHQVFDQVTIGLCMLPLEAASMWITIRSLKYRLQRLVEEEVVGRRRMKDAVCNSLSTICELSESYYKSEMVAIALRLQGKHVCHSCFSGLQYL